MTTTSTQYPHSGASCKVFKSDLLTVFHVCVCYYGAFTTCCYAKGSVQRVSNFPCAPGWGGYSHTYPNICMYVSAHCYYVGAPAANPHPFPPPVSKGAVVNGRMTKVSNKLFRQPSPELLSFPSRKVVPADANAVATVSVVLKQPTSLSSPLLSPPNNVPCSDPAHVPFAHHGVLGSRIMGAPIPTDIDEEALPGASATPSSRGIMR